MAVLEHTLWVYIIVRTVVILSVSSSQLMLDYLQKNHYHAAANLRNYEVAWNNVILLNGLS